MSKLAETNGLLVFYYLKFKDQMDDVRSKFPPWGYASQSNSRGLPELHPPPPLDLTLIVALAIHIQHYRSNNNTSDWCLALTIDHFSEATELSVTYDLLPARTIEIFTLAICIFSTKGFPYNIGN